MAYEEAPLEVAVDVVDDGEAVVVVRGELDLGAVAHLEDCIDSVRRPGRPLVVDMSGVTFMDSSGVNVLLRVRQAAGGGDAAVTLRSPSDAVLATLEMAGIETLFRTTGGAAQRMP